MKLKTLPVKKSLMLYLFLSIRNIQLLEEGKKTIKKLIKMLKVDGELFVFSYFNDHDVDVLINHRKYYDNKLGKLESGWNIYSKKTIERFLEKERVSYKFYNFSMPFQIKKKRSY